MAREKIQAEPRFEADVPAESVYSAAALAENHKAFRVPREIVTVALRLAGRQSATFSEAAAIIEKFKNEEVK